MNYVLQILRYLVLIAIAAFGLDGLIDTVGMLKPSPKGLTGMWLCVAALIVAVEIVGGIKSGRLPLWSWYALPFVVGTAAGLLAFEFSGGLQAELPAVFLGFAVGLVVLPCFQLWADRHGPRTWHFVFVPFVAPGFLFVVGVVMHLVRA